jgi:hypothetical protein
MTEAACVRAELAGTLQSHRLRVEHASGHHQLIELDHVVEVLGELRQIITDLLALGIEVLQILNFKLGGDGHDSLPE